MEKQHKKGTSIHRLRSIKTKLIAGMTAFALIPTVVLGSISNLYTENAMAKEIDHSSLQMTKEVNRGLGYYLSGVQAQIKQMSTNQDFKEYFLHPENQSYRQALLESIQNSRGDYLNVYFGAANKDMLLYPAQELPADYDPTQRDWYKKAIEHKGSPIINEPYQDAVTGKMVITIAQAVENNGEVMGVFGVDIDLDTLSKNVNEITVGEEGYAFILSADGTAITHKDEALIGTTELTKLSIWSDIQSKSNGSVEYTDSGEEYFSSFYTNKQTGWKVITVLEKQELEAASQGIENISMLLMLIFGLISSLIAYIFGRRIANHIQIIKDAFEHAAQGDLTIRVNVKSKDELQSLGESFNMMMGDLSQALQKVETSSKTVLQTSSSLSAMTEETTASVSEVAQAIGEIASGAVKQAQNVEIGSEEMNQLSYKLDHISQSTSEMSQISHSSSQLSHKGLEQVVLLASKSEHTKSSTAEVAQVVKEVEGKMEEINLILRAITDITNQTNLLSLNASIEAARAGEHGKGFAVVANEVRNLAEQSKQSAVEIESMLHSIKAVVGKAVHAMDRTNQVVGEQEQVVADTKEIFTEILSSINRLGDKVEEVKGSVAESQRNKSLVVREMDSITGISQQTASGTEQVSASAEEISAIMDEFASYANGLKDLSQQLDSEIRRFRLGE